MRRQTATSGINPAGSSRALRLDPLSLPLSFHAQDVRADGGVRQIELHRERVVLRRAVQRHADGGQRSRQRLSRHRAARHRRRADAGAGAPRSVADHSARASVPTATRSPPPGRCGATSSRSRNCRKTSRASRAARRRRHNAIRARRPKFLVRRRAGDLLNRGERLIAANARSSHGTEDVTRIARASPRRPAAPQTATAPHRGWT